MKSTAQKAQDPETRREPQDLGIRAWPQTSGLSSLSSSALGKPFRKRYGVGGGEIMRNKGEMTLQLSTEHTQRLEHHAHSDMYCPHLQVTRPRKQNESLVLKQRRWNPKVCMAPV